MLLLSLLTSLSLYHHSILLHDFHLSKCEVNYDTKSGDLQIAVHIFIDDFDNALTKIDNRKLYLGTAKELENTDLAIEKYINSKLIIQANGAVQKLNLLGKEMSNDQMAVWCYLEVSNIKDLKSLHIENKILTELFNDQKNIVDFTVDKKKKHFSIFDSKKTKEEYHW